MSSREPPPLRLSLPELLELVKREVGLELRVCMPARVLEYVPADPAAPRPTPPRAWVRCDLYSVLAGDQDEAEGSDVYVPPETPGTQGDILREYAGGKFLVPVHFPGNWGGWSRGELLPGELGKLVFADRSLDTWQVDGGVGDPVDPAFPDLHGYNLCDAFFEPGVRSGRAMSASVPGTSQVPEGASAWGLADGSAGLTVRHPTGDPTTQRDLALVTTGQLARVDAAGTVVAGDPATAKAVALAEAIVEIFEALAADVTAWAPPDAPAIDNGAALKAAALLPTGFVGRINALKSLIASTKLLADP